jgi:hypothetical protein
MAASYSTVEEIFNIICRHCSPEQREKIIDDLLQVDGNKPFKDTVRRLAARDARVEG